MEYIIAIAFAISIIAAFVAGVFTGEKIGTTSPPPRLPSISHGTMRVLDNGVYPDDIEE